MHTYDDEYTIIVSDWYHQQHSTNLAKFMSIFNPSGAEPVPGASPPLQIPLTC